MKDEKTVPLEGGESEAQEAVEAPSDAAAQSDVAAQSDAADAGADGAAPTQSDAADAGAQPKKGFAEVAKSFITPERIIGLIAILLVPCFFAAWVHLPVTEQVGIKVELSMPDALSKGSSVVGAMESAGDVLDQVDEIVEKAADVSEKLVNVAAVAAKVLNGNANDYKGALSAAVSELIDSVASESPGVSEKVTSKAQSAADQVIDTAVDNAAAAAEGTEIQDAKEQAGEAAAAATDIAIEAQSSVAKAQDAVDKAQAAYSKTLQLAKTILGIALVVWYLFLLLLVVAGILLLVGVRGRYVTGIIALALSTVASLAAIIGVAIANQAVLEAITNALGVWVLAFVPNIIAVTAWPWVVAIVSVLCLVVLCVLLAKRRKQLKAAEQQKGMVPIEPIYVESSEQKEAVEA